MIKSLCLLFMFGQSPLDSLEFKSPAEIISQAESFEAEGDYEKAVELYLTVSKNDTSYIQVQNELMSAYNALKQYDKSIAIGVLLKDEYSKLRNNIYTNLGNAYLDGGNIDKGIETYQVGLKLFPYNHILLYNLGLAYNRKGNYAGAISCFQRSARINPYYGSNHIMLGYISMLQGHRTKALLSYLTYMAINPSRNGTLVFMENLVSDASRNEGTIDVVAGNNLFSYYDDLLRSKAALDERFKREVNFNASIVKQSELLFSKLVYVENTEDFWMDYYVPLYTSLAENNLHTAFLYYILQSTDNDEVMQWIEKNDDKKTVWIELANKVLGNNRNFNETEILGEKNNYSFWYFSNNTLSAVGNQIDEETRVGPWAFFYESSHLNATGKYNEQGQKIGTWNYYHENGRINRVEQYDNEGSLIKPVIYYYENGAISNVAKLKDNQLHGALEYYFNCGQIKESMPYQEGVKNGKGKMYFTTGETELEYEMKNGEFDGVYTLYFKNGQISKKYNYSSGLINGNYLSYYINGQENEAGQYTNDTITGDWIGYHPNGNISYTGTMRNDMRYGEWKDFYANGKLSEETPYDDQGEIHGQHKSFRDDGTLESITIYQHGKIIGYQMFANNNELIYEVNDAEGNMDYKGYYQDGALKVEGSLEGGKFNGDYTSYFNNGKIFQNSTMLDDNFLGTFEEYYSTGQLYIECTYKEGTKNGLYKQYYKNGKVQMEGLYVNDQPEHLWKIYYPDGSLNEETYYISGMTNGWSNYYAPGNQVDYSLKTDMGILVGIREYDSLGNIFHDAKIGYGTGTFAKKNIGGDTILKAKMQCGEIYSDINKYYSGGKIASVDPLHKSHPGEFVSYSEDGELLVKGSYLNGQQNGLWQFFHTNGKLKAERFYEGGLIEKQLKRYYYNGQLESVCDYTNDEPHGTCKYYDQFGNHQLTKIYDKEDGHIAYVNVLSKDTIPFESRENFTLNSYFTNGKLAVTQNYRYGKFDGNTAYYNDSGQIIESVNYKLGELNGKYITYYSNGNVYLETTYKDGVKHGAEKEYFENGKMRRVTQYNNDRIHGSRISYNQNGTVKTKTYYWNDEVY